MLAYAHGTTTTPLLGETIGANLERTAAAYGDREALVVRHQGVRWTYTELDERENRMARALVAAGLEPGDRMDIWAPNCAEGQGPVAHRASNATARPPSWHVRWPPTRGSQPCAPRSPT